MRATGKQMRMQQRLTCSDPRRRTPRSQNSVIPPLQRITRSEALSIFGSRGPLELMWAECGQGPPADVAGGGRRAASIAGGESREHGDTQRTPLERVLERAGGVV